MIYSREKNNIALVVTSSEVKGWHFSHGNIFTIYRHWTLYWQSIPKLSSTHHWTAMCGRLRVKDETQVKTQWAMLNGHRGSLSSVPLSVCEVRTTIKFCLVLEFNLKLFVIEMILCMPVIRIIKQYKVSLPRFNLLTWINSLKYFKNLIYKIMILYILHAINDENYFVLKNLHLSHMALHSIILIQKLLNIFVKSILTYLVLLTITTWILVQWLLHRNHSLNSCWVTSLTKTVAMVS